MQLLLRTKRQLLANLFVVNLFRFYRVGLLITLSACVKHADIIDSTGEMIAPIRLCLRSVSLSKWSA